MPRREWSDVPEGALKLSSTTIGSLELSPCRVTIPHVMVPSEAMAFGTVAHGSLERAITGQATWLQAQVAKNIAQWAKEDLGDELDLDAKLNGFDLDWYAEIGDAVAAFKPVFTSMLSAGWEVLECEQPRARFRPLADAHVEGYWFVTGGIDLLLGRGDERFGVDFKTSARGWWKDDTGVGRAQHLFYSWLAEPDFGLVEDWAYYVYDRSRRDWKFYPVKAKPKAIDAALIRADGWAKFLALPEEIRPHLCTPTDGKKRGWWSKPQYNPVWGLCPTCSAVGDEYDDVQLDEEGPWFK